MCFCLSCEDPESINLKNGSVQEAENISFDPFSMTSESWAEHVKNYFSHDILIKSWGFDDIYIAIYRNENWLVVSTFLCELMEEGEVFTYSPNWICSPVQFHS